MPYADKTEQTEYIKKWVQKKALKRHVNFTLRSLEKVEVEPKLKERCVKALDTLKSILSI